MRGVLGRGMEVEEGMDDEEYEGEEEEDPMDALPINQEDCWEVISAYFEERDSCGSSSILLTSLL